MESALKPGGFKRSRRKSVISFSDQQQWVFEEQEPKNSNDEHVTIPTVDKMKLENTMNYGKVQVSYLNVLLVAGINVTCTSCQ